MKSNLLSLLLVLIALPSLAAENSLSEAEKKDGWLLLFDGNTLDGWETSNQKPSQRPVEDHSINPRKCGGYMVMPNREFDNFNLSLDFKIAKGCNSGVFVRTFPLTCAPARMWASMAWKSQSTTRPRLDFTIPGPSMILCNRARTRCCRSASGIIWRSPATRT